MKKIIVLCIGTFVLVFGCIWGNTMMANEPMPAAVGATLPEDHAFMTIDEDGMLVEMDVEQMEEETKEQQASRNEAQTYNIGGIKDIQYGVVNFRTKSSSTLNTSYVDANTGESGYTNGYYAADAAYLGYENGKVKFMLSGVVGLVNPSEVEVIDLEEDEDTTWYVSFYRCDQGVLKHYINNNINNNSYYGTITVGEIQPYMKNNVIYYSYDGHYFYTDYNTMIDDYKKETRANAINPDDPYFNYYQFVSNRSKTTFTAEEINNYIKYYVTNYYKTNESKMFDMGKYYIEYQNTYGANALAVFGVSANESAFGTSSIAKTKNNLFGHSAYDSNPEMAGKYNAPQESIEYHAQYYINLWYSTPKYSTYHGSFLGDKGSGMLSYASDPYWGEKAAHWAWSLDIYTKGKSDVGNETLVFKSQGAINVRKEPSTTSTVLYTTPANENMSFVLLDEVKGTTVSGSDVWYKIQLDTPLTSNRSSIDYSGTGYSFENSYGYIHSSLLSKNGYIADSGTDDDSSQITYKKGDVNGDGYISSKDYNAIKNHITGSKTLTGDVLKRADVNGDGYISSKDYNAIKNHITGAKLLF